MGNKDRYKGKRRVELWFEGGDLDELRRLARLRGMTRKAYCESILLGHLSGGVTELGTEGVKEVEATEGIGTDPSLLVNILVEEEAWDYTNRYWLEEQGFELWEGGLADFRWGSTEGGVAMHINGIKMWKTGLGMGSEVDLGSIRVRLGARNMISIID